MSDVLEKVDEQVATTNNGDHDRFQHYVKKEAIGKNLLEGAPMVALCGKVWSDQVDRLKFPICPTCTEIIKSLPE